MTVALRSTVHDNGIMIYFGHYFNFQTNFMIFFFQIHYFRLKLNLLALAKKSKSNVEKQKVRGEIKKRY